MVKYLVLFAGGWVLSTLLTPVVRWLAIRKNVLDVPNERKVHAHPIPRLGGLAIFIAFTLVMSLAFSPLMPWRHPLAEISPHWWTGFLAAAAIVVTLGVFDDLKPLGARVKFLTQALAALMAMSFGYMIRQVDLPWGAHLELGLWSIPVTLLWIVGLTNAFNLIDGLDGLASGVGLISSLTLMGVALLGQNVEAALICATLAGCLVGFLRYNSHPASIFLGDSGSLFLGFSLAAVSISTSQKSTVAVSLFVPMLAFGLPIMDTLLAMLRRFLRGLHLWETTEQGSYRWLFLRGRSMFQADRDHIHHRLMHLGITHQNAVIFLYGICGLTGLAALGIASYHNLNNGLMLSAITIAAVFAIRQLRYKELELLNNGSFVPLSKLPFLGLGAFQILSDLVMVSFAYYLAFWLHGSGDFTSKTEADFITSLPAVLLTKVLVFHLTGLYRVRWRNAGVPELMRGFRSMAFGSFAAAGILAFFQLPHGGTVVLILDFYVMTSFLLGSRFSARILQHYAHANPANKRKVLIYGTGPTAALLVREIVENQRHSLTPVGFIEDSPGRRSKLLHGYPVLGSSAMLERVLETGQVEELIIAEPELSAEQLEELLVYGQRAGVVVRQFRVSLEELATIPTEPVQSYDIR